MATISANEFLKGGKVTLAQEGFQPPSQPTQSESYSQNVISQVKGNIQEGAQSLTASGEGKMNPLLAGANIAKNVSGALIAPLTQLPGLKQLGEGFGKAGQAIVDSKAYSPVVDTLANNVSPEVLGGISDTAETALNMTALQGGIESVKKGYNYTAGKINQVKGTFPDGGGGSESANIMNRVARLKPTDATRFEDMSGMTHGEYLKQTGNFGPPDKIIANESTKFVKSKNSVDLELSKLPGVYQDGAITDALTGLYERAVKTSGDNTPSPYLKQVQDWMAKNKQGGLTMDEINGVKRLYEREVKLGYNKLNNPDGVAQATNIDNALREWQVKKAETLGFKNIGELNKQTQLSKFLINKLGDQLVGKNGLNGISLTDWIVLSGGSPEAITGFLTKKFFSSATVQSKIAELLNRGNPVKGQITPDVGQSKVLQLPAPTSGFRSQIEGSTPIRIAPKGSNIEMTSKEGIIPSTKISQSVSTKETQSLPEPSTRPKKINMQGGYIKNPFANIPENDWKFLSDFSSKVKNKQSVSKNDYVLIKKIFKENKLQIPNTPRKTADYIATINDAMAQKSLDSEMDNNLKN